MFISLLIMYACLSVRDQVLAKAEHAILIEKQEVKLTVSKPDSEAVSEQFGLSKKRKKKVFSLWLLVQQVFFLYRKVICLMNCSAFLNWVWHFRAYTFLWISLISICDVTQLHSMYAKYAETLEEQKWILQPVGCGDTRALGKWSLYF